MTDKEKELQAEAIDYYRKRIAELEKENAGLKANYEVLKCSVGDFGELQDRLEEEQRKNNGLEEQLTKAKEIIKELLFTSNELDENTRSKAEQFLKECE